jgi:hypothetical protein
LPAVLLPRIFFVSSNAIIGKGGGGVGGGVMGEKLTKEYIKNKEAKPEMEFLIGIFSRGFWA